MPSMALKFGKLKRFQEWKRMILDSGTPQSVNPVGKLATVWGKLKARN